MPYASDYGFSIDGQLPSSEPAAPSFTRIRSLINIKVQHQDGIITTFGSEAAYGIFVRGLALTNYTLYDEGTKQWVVGTVEQLAENLP